MAADSAHTRFWQWFERHADRLSTAVFSQDTAAREDAFAELREATDAVEPGLVLEFGYGREDTLQLIVSADGKPERVDAVKDFVASAPALAGWEVLAFRPRDSAEDIKLALEGEEVEPADVWFRVAEDEDGLDLTLYVRGLNAANEKLRGLGASLLAEHLVGERDALTLLNSQRIQPLPPDPAAAGLRPLPELPGVFDAARAARYPPPGSLDIDMEADWMTMQGEIGGSPALILFHAGLRPAAGHPDYDRRLTVSIPFYETTPEGMPETGEEFSDVASLGDYLTDALREGQQSLLAMAITSDGRRDLVLYTSDADAALQRLEDLRSPEQTHPFEASLERDTYWGMYRSFLQAGEQEEEAEE
jgi:hypothetical protein